MADTNKKVTLWYALKDQVTSGLSRMQSAGKTFSDKMNRAFGSFKKAMDSSLTSVVALGNIMASAVQKAAGAVIKWLGEARQEYQTFQKTLANTYTLLDENAFQKHGKEIEDGAIKIMQQYNLGIEDVNKALFDSVSAGVNAGDAIGFMEQAARLAKGGVTNLGTAVDGMTSIINAFNLDMDRATEVSNALFTAQKFGKTTVEALSNNIGKVAPIAKAAGLSFEELLAATSQLTLSGISTEEAVTALKGALTSIISPSEQAAGVFKELGIPMGSAAFEGGKFGETMEMIKNQTDGNIDKIAELIPNIRGLLSVTSVATKQGLQKYDEILKAIETDTTSLNRAFEMQMATMKELIETERGKLIPAKQRMGLWLSKLELLWLKFVSSLTETKNVFIAASGWMGQLAGKASALAEKLLHITGIRKQNNKEEKTVHDETVARDTEAAKVAEETTDRKIAANQKEKDAKLEQNQKFLEMNQELEAVAEEIKREFDQQAKEFEKLSQQERVELLITHLGRKKVLKTRHEIAKLQEEKKFQEASTLQEQLYQEAFIKINEDRIKRIAKAEKAAAKEKAKLDKKEKREELDRQNKQEKMIRDAKRASSDFFGNLAEIAKSQGQEAFTAYKRFAQAQALIATYESAVKAFNSLASIPIVGTALGAAAATAATVAGMMRVRQIENTSVAAEHGMYFKGTAAGTRATFAENNKDEAVIPLQDEEGKQALRDAVGGGAGNIHVTAVFGGHEMRPAIVEIEREKDKMRKEGVL